MLLRVTASAHAVVVSVRRPNATPWLTEISARPGDAIQYEVTITNAGNAPLCDVVVVNNLAPGAVYVDESSRLLRGTNTKEMRLPDGIVDQLSPSGTGRPPSREVGVHIGDVSVGGIAKVRFEARLETSLGPESILRNVALVRALGLPFVYNTATVRIEAT